MGEFATNQLLIWSNLKEDPSASIPLDIPITFSQFVKWFTAREEVDAKDIEFIIVDDGFNLGDLLHWIEGETIITLLHFGSSLAGRTII